MNIGIIGLGAIGCVYASQLSKNKDIKLYAIANESRKEKILNGININNEKYFFNIANNEIMDYIIISTKYNGLKSAIIDIKKHVSNNTTIVSFLNGVDSELIINKEYPNKVIGGITRISSTLVNNNYVFNIDSGLFLIGELNKEVTNRVKVLEKIFNSSGLKCKISNDITFDLWHKFMANISENQSQAILGIPFGAYKKSVNADMVRILLAKEIIKLANKKGINLTMEHLEYQNKVVKNVIPESNKTSMLQDLENGRKTEVDMFAKMALEMGKEEGIEMPLNEFVYYMIKALEDKNEGII